MRQRLLSRSANALVKPSGMCCTMRIGGVSTESSVSTLRSASVPPVEVPMAMSLSERPGRNSGEISFCSAGFATTRVATRGMRGSLTLALSPSSVSGRVATPELFVVRAMREFTAARTSSPNRRATSPTEKFPPGFETTSNAPASRHSSARAQPRGVTELQMMVGTG